MITIFTPVYNRKDTLLRLYESLKRQTVKEFQWIVVDDGSTDGTKELMADFTREEAVDIIYEYQENSGKMRAVNRGVQLAQGEYFFIVDSDDYITDNSIELIMREAENLPKNLGGMIFRKIDTASGKITGKPYPEYRIDSSPIEIVYKLGIDGDKAEVFRTDILKKNPFKEFKGEKFIPEATVWVKIGEEYKMRYIDEGIYFFEYLEDGYTRNFNTLMKKNPKGFEFYYKEMLKYNLPLSNKIKFIIRLIQSKYYKLIGGNK